MCTCLWRPKSKPEFLHRFSLATKTACPRTTTLCCLSTETIGRPIPGLTTFHNGAKDPNSSPYIHVESILPLNYFPVLNEDGKYVDSIRLVIKLTGQVSQSEITYNFNKKINHFEETPVSMIKIKL